MPDLKRNAHRTGARTVRDVSRAPQAMPKPARCRCARMKSTHEPGHRATIMALSPVIPVLTDRRPRTCRAARAGAGRAAGCACSRSRCARRCALAAIEAMRAAVPGGDHRRRHAHACRGLSRLRDRAGAQFGVTPGLTPELAAAARGARLPAAARHHDADRTDRRPQRRLTVLKLFPAQQAGGVGMLKALGAPFPDMRSVRPVA